MHLNLGKCSLQCRIKLNEHTKCFMFLHFVTSYLLSGMTNPLIKLSLTVEVRIYFEFVEQIHSYKF